MVPAILAQSPELKLPEPSSSDLLPAFLKINGDLRRMNAGHITALARQTSPTMLWKGVFRQLSNSQVESAFADYRTYFYRNKEVDRQVHLGFDLARTAEWEVRTLSKPVWVALLVFTNILGALMWLVAGRPQRP